jgi:hypothetical protein
MVYECLTGINVGNRKGDIIAILPIGSDLIGITSKGDPGSKLEERLKLFVKLGCTIIICATRTDGETAKSADSLRRGKNGYSEVILFKQRAEKTKLKMECNNRMMAQKIIGEINRLIFHGG